MRELAAGQFPQGLDLSHFERVQLNLANCKPGAVDAGALVRNLRPGIEYIVQVGEDPIDALAVARELRDRGHACSLLLDSSGGRGRSPLRWPACPEGFACGFAGGLGPENLLTELERLSPLVGQGVTWVDMESRVRGADGIALDLDKVRRCLEIAEPYSRPSDSCGNEEQRQPAEDEQRQPGQ
ncbi:MAG: hypothetical protein QM765_37580 [Myxococcales bacterium]